MQSILVVCIGNICRSPMAEAMLAQALPTLQVSSAGVGALVGQGADPKALSLMAARGLDVSSHRARQLTQQIAHGSELILVMDDDQRQHIERRYPTVRGRVHLLGAAAKLSIPDPYRMGDAAFEHALQLIDAGVQNWAHRIKSIL